ncbi:hypothetical protein TL16_g07127 [Triparma laevis f. inornata]|nr:hypothetical protein TL16_g07127 [Triparma laevis f. inornata]
MLGFCGIDDSIDPDLLLSVSRSYSFVEWGVLFRPDQEGEPRYATTAYVNDKLYPAFKSSNGAMRLAAHLCGERVNEVLRGDDGFLKTLSALGFARVQINATAVNGVDTSDLRSASNTLRFVILANPQLEFILQRSEETSPLWSPFDAKPEKNISMLFDESKGTGVLPATYTPPPATYPVGYAGGIGPKNVTSVLESVLKISTNSDFWIDMESSLRSKVDGVDSFDINKCQSVIRSVCQEVKLFKFCSE